MPLSTCSMYQPGLQAGSTDRHLKNSVQHFGGSSTWQTRKGATYTALLAGDKSQVPPDRNIRVASASKQAVSIEGPEDGTDAITATAETPRTRLEITFPRAPSTFSKKFWQPVHNGYGRTGKARRGRNVQAKNHFQKIRNGRQNALEQRHSFLLSRTYLTSPASSSNRSPYSEWHRSARTLAAFPYTRIPPLT